MTSTEKEYYLNQGYTDTQIEELEAGKEAGLDISVYENPALTPMHMYQIRLGLAEGLNMRPYADGRFDWFQLEEIRKGLSDLRPVHLYARPEIPSEKMHQMRRGLDDGMDLSEFLKYDAQIMSQVRKALVQKIDITNYVKQGYDAGQLEEIRRALEAGLDIPQYLKPEFRAVSISEIAKGILQGVDVAVYAKTCYTWTQMREIRKGLRNQLDVTLYLSPLYDRYQMREIRLGLEDGLEVYEYTSLMYPAEVMQKMRLDLMSTGVVESFGEVTPEEINEQNKDGLFVRISADQMTAYLRFDASKFGITTRKDILRTLRLLGITQNIDPRMMDDLMAGRHLSEPVIIAKGRPAVDGEDGYYEYFFETKKDRAPKINEDGSVDYRDVEWFEQVKKDQKLAYYHAAGNGEPGVTVNGKRIAPKKGKELPALRGKGMHVLPDKKTYIADFDGRVEIDANKLEVSRILYVPEVTLSTGNIRFEGNVEVLGDVTSGTMIEAGGDVVVNGFVEAACISAGGDIILKKGANGHGTGVLIARGNVEGRFFESISVTAGNQITCNYCLNCSIYSEDSVMITGGKGMIVGGSVFAVREIRVHNLGNAAGTRAWIRLGISEAMQKESREIEERLAELNGQLLVLEKGKRDMESKFPPEVRNIMEMYVKIANAIYTLGLQKKEAIERKERLSAQIVKTLDAKLIVSGRMYDGNIIEINGRKTYSTECDNVTARVEENRVGIFNNRK